MCCKIFRLLSVAFVICLVACEDKEKVVQHAEQSREILILREELTSLKDQLDDKPTRDPSSELEKTERLVEEKKGIISDLEEELTQMKSDRKEAEESFSDYKKKYSIAE